MNSNLSRVEVLNYRIAVLINTIVMLEMMDGDPVITQMFSDEKAAAEEALLTFLKSAEHERAEIHGRSKSLPMPKVEIRRNIR